MSVGCGWNCQRHSENWGKEMSWTSCCELWWPVQWKTWIPHGRNSSPAVKCCCRAKWGKSEMNWGIYNNPFPLISTQLEIQTIWVNPKLANHSMSHEGRWKAPFWNLAMRETATQKPTLSSWSLTKSRTLRVSYTNSMSIYPYNHIFTIIKCKAEVFQ